MSSSILSTSYIKQAVQSYSASQREKLISPLNTRKQRYQNLNTAWSGLKSKLTSFRAVLSDLKDTTSSGVFGAKLAASTNESIVSATAASSASSGSHTLRVNQLAKADIAVSSSMISGVSNTIVNTEQSFQVSRGSQSATVNVTYTAEMTNEDRLQAIADAIADHRATVSSNELQAGSSANHLGEGTFVFEFGGVEKTIEYDATGKTYSELLTEVAEEITSLSGISAEVVTTTADANGNVYDEEKVSLKLTADNTAKSLTIDASSNDLLQELGLEAEAVQAASGLVNASVFDPISGKTRLSLTSTETGYDNRIQLTDISGDTVSFLGLDGSREKVKDDSSAGYIYDSKSATDNELNAHITFNGTSVQRNSNVIDDLVSNVTFDLNSVNAADDEDVTVTINSDTEEMRNKINTFITSFNEAYGYVKSRFYSDDFGRGVFTGDATAQSVLSSFREVALNQVSGIAAGNIDSLRDLGVSFDPTAGLSLSDAGRLDDALEASPEQVADLFNADNGVAARLYDRMESFVKADGVISRLTDSYNNGIQYINDKIESTQNRIDKSAEVMRSRYEQLQQQLVALYNAQSAYQSFASNFGF